MPEKKIQSKTSEAEISEKLMSFTKTSETEFLRQLLKDATQQEITEYFTEFPESKEDWKQ